MIDERAKIILRKRGVIIRDGMTNAEAWAAVRATEPPKRPKPSVVICFTGFTDAEKAGLTTTAENLGWSVSKSLAKSTTHLCCGATPGQKKLADAEANKIKIISQAEFETMMETGEII